MMIELLAWSGALLSSLLSVPQLVRALRSERLEGVSAATYWLVLGNALVWATWAILVEQYAAGVPALVNGPAAVIILVRLRRQSPTRRVVMKDRRQASNPCAPSVDHNVCSLTVNAALELLEYNSASLRLCRRRKPVLSRDARTGSIPAGRRAIDRTP